MNTTHPATAETLVPAVREVLALRLGTALLNIPADGLFSERLDNYDSLTATECIYAIEERFGIEVDFTIDDVRFWFSSIERIARFVAERLEDAGVHHA